MKTTRAVTCLLPLLLLVLTLPCAMQAQVLVTDTFDGVNGAAPDAAKFDWGGQVGLDGAGQLSLSTDTANTSWIKSKAGTAVSLGQTLVLQMRLSAYAEPAVYGDKQPRGLRVGSDANNVLEFYSIYGTTIGLRARKDWVETLVSYPFPSGVYSQGDYEISVTTTTAVFRVDGVIAGTITNNIPTGSLNFYISTYDGGFGNVPVTIDSMELSLTNDSPQLSPMVTTEVATSLTATSATLNGSGNPNGASGTGWFRYATASPGTGNDSFGIRVPASGGTALGAGASPVAYSQAITGLNPGTTYYCCAIAQNAAGMSFGSVLSFTTAPRPPLATTSFASDLVAVGINATATLNGTVNPNSSATAWFEWGRTCGYGHQTQPVIVTSNAMVSALVNLQAGFPYHYRVVASNSAGCTYGNDQTFWSPRLELAGSAILTNAYGASFVEPGVAAKGAPLAIAAGFNTCVTLKADGTVAGWGQYGLPAGLTNVVAICAGDYVFTALRADSTITNWGFVYQPPSITSNVVTMANGSYHGLLLLSNGIVTAWGPNNYGDTNVPSGLTNVIALAAGGDQSLALHANGTVTQWGDTREPVPEGASNVIALAAAHYHSVALKPDGTVIAWGNGSNGKTNVPVDLTNAVAVAAAGHHSLALRSTGRIVGWGMNPYGELSPPTGATNMVEIATGYYHSMGLREDGTVLAWGLNNYNQTVVPTNLMDLSFAIAAQGNVDCFTPGTYTLTYWTTNQIGAVATTTRTVVVLPAILAEISSFYASDIMATGTNAVAALNGTVNPNGSATAAWFEWGQTLGYENISTPTALGNGSIPIPVNLALTNLVAGQTYHFRLVASNSVGVAYGSKTVFWAPLLALNAPASMTNDWGAPFVDPGATVRAAPLAISAGGSHSLALKADGTVACWGYDAYGQATVPVTATNVVAIAAGAYHSLALRADGTVVGWGYNSYGQAGAPSSATNVTAIAGDQAHSLALKADGTVVGWGDNSSGQATPPSSVTNAVAIAAGKSHSLAMRPDGTLIGWGSNGEGQTTPATNVSDAVAITAGVVHSLALKSDGTVVGWGNNDYGQTNMPVNATNVVAIDAAGSKSQVLKADGTAIEWGYNAYTPPADATNLVAISMGYETSLGLRSDGTVVGWGPNSYGQSTIPTNLYVLNLPVTVSGTVNANVPGTYVLTYSVTNSLGAVATATRTVVVASLDFYFATNAGAIRITGYKGSGGTVTIPGNIYGYPVTTIGDRAFELKSSITNVLIPDSVTTIGYEAFYRCTGLSSVTIGNGVTSIGAGAFTLCASLASVTIPNSATSIGNSAFAAGTGMTNISVGALNPNYSSLDGVLFNKDRTSLIQCPGGKAGSYDIPNSVTNIGDSAFSNCRSLSSVTIGNCVTSIGSGAFSYCTDLSSVTIPDSVTSLGDYAFYYCAGLSSVTIGNGVTGIGTDAFSHCTSLTNITIGDSVTTIGTYAFSSCSGLNSVTIPNSVTSIGAYAFAGCAGLSSVTIPGSVTSILDGAFQQCPSLSSITIPASVTNIGDWALAHCTGLTSVFCQGNAPSLGGGSVFYNSTAATVYRLAEAANWPPVPDLWAGRPTALWSLIPQVPSGSSGVFSNRFGFAINWPGMQGSVVVEACTNLSNPVWLTVGTNALTNGTSYFSDPQWTNYSGRFYRLRSP